MYPKIYLAIDNCFASKRWTAPEDWARVIKDLGVNYVEASADTELDPLYMGREYLAGWKERVKAVEKNQNVKVANLFSGHGTYSTLGLAHPEATVRKNMLDNWFKPMIEIAAELDAGMGFYAHAFPVEGLQSQKRYEEYCKILTDGLLELNEYARQVGCKYLALEQMYTPHQIPWTIAGTKQLMQQLSDGAGHPFFFTEDVGHHLTTYVKPTVAQIQAAVAEGKEIWLGNDEAYRVFDQAVAKGSLSDAQCAEIVAAMDATPYMFAEEKDGDCFCWLEEIGCYSPIVHLQQTDGNASAHKSFTAECNRHGKITAKKVLQAIKQSYDAPVCKDLPNRCSEIYLTLELFSGTAQTVRSILRNYSETVQYWRQYIPEDGIALDALLAKLEK